MKNKTVFALLAVLAALALAVGLGTQEWGESEASAPAPAMAPEAEPELEAAVDRALPEGSEPDTGAGRTVERVATAEAESAEPDSPTAGWWLVGRVSGIPEGEHGSTRLRITGSRDDGWSSHGISAPVQSGGNVRVDLQEIFRSNRVLPSELIARVSHPGLREAEERWPVSRKQRQAGHRPGELVLFEVDLHLDPSPGEVRGLVALPEGYAYEDMLVSLIPVVDEVPDVCNPVSQEGCGAAGEFRLSFDRSGRYHLLATHRERELRPALLDLELTEGRVELEEPLELDEGAVLDGVVTLNSAVPGFELSLGAMRKGPVSGAYCQKLPGTFWIDGGYLHSSAKARSTDAGKVRITGLSPGVHRLRVNAIQIDDEWVSLGSLGQGVRVTRDLELPSQGAVIGFGYQVQLFRTVSGGKPLPYVKVVARTRNSSSTTNTGPNGQFAQVYPSSSSVAPTVTLDFSAEGYEKHSVPLEGGPQTLTWQEVEMVPTMAGEATLVLSLLGDPERSLERFALLLLREGEEYRSSDLLSWQKTHWIRREEAIRVEGIEPGAYRLMLMPNSPSSRSRSYWPDTDTGILTEVLDIEFSAGEQRELSLRLRTGGRLFLSAICPQGDCGGRTGPVFYRIKGGGGEVVESSWVTPAGSQSNSRSIGALSTASDSYLDPALEPGVYELEVWTRGEDAPSIAHPFRILAGEVTRLEIDDPR